MYLENNKRKRKMNITTEYTRKVAHASLVKFVPNLKICSTPEATLAASPWKELIQNEPAHSELATLNFELNPRGCLGRVALCFAIIERFFLTDFERFKYGEVNIDWFWVTLMNQWKNHYSLKSTPVPESWVTELLTYEDPHGIVVGKNAYQFEPLSSMMEDQKIWHVGVSTFDPWPAITSALIVSQVIVTNDLDEKMRLLGEAEKICPNTCIVKQNRIEPLIMLGRDDEAMQVLRELVSRRPSARLFFILETLFGEKHQICDEMYGHRLWEIIKNKLEKDLQ